MIGDLPGFMRLVAGIPDSSGITLDSIATRTRLSSPLGVAADSSGFLYIGDTRSRIFRVSSAGRIERLLNHDGCATDDCVRRPQSIAVMHGGNSIVIADDMSDRVWRLNVNTGQLTVLAGTGENAVSPDGANAASSPIASPTAVVILPDGRVAFAERNAHRIRVINGNGTLGTLAGNGDNGEAAEGAPALSSPINFPTGLALSGDTLFFTETGSHTIRFVDLSAGSLHKLAGTGVPGLTGETGPALAATFDYPVSLAVIGRRLFVADQNNDRVRMINRETGMILTFSGTGTRTFNGNGRAAGETNLFRPHGLAISPFGFLYLADSGHHIVWRTSVAP